MAENGGRVALVTGSSRGIGRAIAARLAADGMQVVVNYVSSAEAADELVEEIVGAGGEAIAIGADVSRPEQAAGLVEETLETFGHIDVLVNNAGITRDGLLMRMPEEDWDAVLGTNLRSVFLVTRPVVKHMMRRRQGRIVNITSVAGLDGNAGQTNYAAAKAGMVGFTKSLAREVGKRGITVNAVAPGFVRTDLTAELPDRLLEGATELTPLGRLGEPADVAGAVSFLCGPDAAFVTAQVLRVDGGMTL